MKHSFGKLTQVLDETPGEQPSVKPKQSCALSIPKSCCNGLGFQLTTKGPRTVAFICDCVMACPSCLGHAQLTDNNNKSYSCIKNSPIRTVNLINSADIPARYKDSSLKGFSNYTGNGSATINEIQEWIRNFSADQDQGMIISGPVGVGKTYLMAAIAKSLIAKGVGVKFVDFFQLLAEIKAGYSDRKSEMTVIGPLLEVDVLVIDELGKGRNTEFELTILDQLVMGRYNSQKVTVASTNCSFAETAPSYAMNVPLDQESSPQGKFAPENFGTLESRVGKRIYSRLLETSKLIELSGDDFRRQN